MASSASIKIACPYSVATGIRFGGKVFEFDTEFLSDDKKEDNFHPVQGFIIWWWESCFEMLRDDFRVIEILYLSNRGPFEIDLP